MSAYMNNSIATYDIYVDGKVFGSLSNLESESISLNGNYRIILSTRVDNSTMFNRLNDIMLQSENPVFKIERVVYKKNTDTNEDVRIVEYYECKEFKVDYHFDGITGESHYIISFRDCRRTK